MHYILYPINTFKAFCPVLFIHPFKQLHQSERTPTYESCTGNTSSHMATLAHIPFQHCIPSLSFAHQASMMQTSYTPRSSGISWESSTGLSRRRTDTRKSGDSFHLHQAPSILSQFSVVHSWREDAESFTFMVRRADLEQQHCMDPRPRASWYLPQLDVSSSSLEGGFSREAFCDCRQLQLLCFCLTSRQC